MNFISNFGAAPVIDDNNFQTYVNMADVDPSKGRGLIPRDFTLEPYCSSPFAVPVSFPLVDPATYDERIEEQEKTNSHLKAFIDLKKIKVKNQQRTNYCWINAPTYCTEVVRCAQGLEYVSLSPASAGSKITGFRNVGGWGTKGLQYIAEHGLVTSDKWPDNSIDRKYDNPDNDEIRKRYRVTEWFDIKPRNIQELYTCLFFNVPVAIGLNFWGHEVTAIRVVKLQGPKHYGVLFANSWGESWGDNGFGVLSGSKQIPDDAIAPSVIVGGNPK